MDKTALNVLVDEHRGAAERVRALALHLSRPALLHTIASVTHTFTH